MHCNSHNLQLVLYSMLVISGGSSKIRRSSFEPFKKKFVGDPLPDQ